MAKRAKLGDFLNSRWMDLAKTKGAEKKVRKEFHKWVKGAKDTEVVRRATQLWGYFQSGDVSGLEKLVIVAALLYLISPVDMVPEAIAPAVGLLDDLGVAALALNYVLSRMDDKKGGKGGKPKSGKAKRKGRSKSRVGEVLKSVQKALG